MGGGSILTGLVLAAVGAFVIDKKFVNASAFALAGAILTFFGFMHGEHVGFAVTPTVAIAYLIVAVFLFGLSRAPVSALDRSAPHEQYRRRARGIVGNQCNECVASPRSGEAIFFTRRPLW